MCLYVFGIIFGYIVFEHRNGIFAHSHRIFAHSQVRNIKQKDGDKLPAMNIT